MEVRTQSEAEAYSVILSKYPMLFAATNTFESLMNSLHDASLTMQFFGAVGVPNHLLYAPNLHDWIVSLHDQLLASGITHVVCEYIPVDGVVLCIDGPNIGTVTQDGNEWVAAYTDTTWMHGIRIGDVYAAGTVEWYQTDNYSGY